MLVSVLARRSQRLRINSSSLSELYADHAGHLLAFFVRRIPVASDAVDLTAETFARAYEARRSFRGATSEDAVAWLFGIARNLLSHHLRDGQIELRALSRLGIERTVLDDEGIDRVLEFSGVHRLAEDARSALEQLSDEQREAVELRVMDELEYAEIAERLGVSQDVARARVSRALRQLGTTLVTAGTADA